MPARLLPLIVAPAILLPLAAYAMRKRQAREAREQVEAEVRAIQKKP